MRGKLYCLITTTTNTPLGLWQSAASFREADFSQHETLVDD